MKMYKLLLKVISLFRFKHFEISINSQTKNTHDDVLSWARKNAENLYRNADGYFLKERERLLEEYGNKRSNSVLRILIHIPPSCKSPGGYSLFYNLFESLKYLGVSCDLLNWDESITEKLINFKPNVLISSDHSSYLNKINWEEVSKYRKKNTLFLGLTASLEEYGNSRLSRRLVWASTHEVDFYYSFRSQEYIKSRVEYDVFFKRGYQIFSIEFGANILKYYPLEKVEKDIDYIFLASSNPDKRKRYYSWFTKIANQYVGFLNGPGWSHVSSFAEREVHNALYARAKIGINLHIDDSINWPSELNERTYILAASGVPQLIDNAKLLPKYFGDDSFYVCSSPEEYEIKFKEILDNPVIARKKARKAFDEVYERHTTFHRAEKFILDLESLFNNKYK